MVLHRTWIDGDASIEQEARYAVLVFESETTGRSTQMRCESGTTGRRPQASRLAFEVLDSSKASTALRMGRVPETWWAQANGNGLAITARQKRQYVGYPDAEADRSLLDRIIAATSNPGDVVLDRFCGLTQQHSIAAQMLHRRCVGIDISPKAADLVRQRMRV